MFNRYPKFIVDYQVRERERIRQEELQYLRERYVPVHTCLGPSSLLSLGTRLQAHHHQRKITISGYLVLDTCIPDISHM